jgi:hypothetical protein
MKDKDWTRVLQERLQDASLPLESEDIAAFAGERRVVSPGAFPQRSEDAFSAPGGQSRRRPMGWWPYALAGVAAAVVAAVLLLHPVSQTPDRLAQQTVTPAVQPATPGAQPGNLAAQPDNPSSPAPSESTPDPSMSSPTRSGISSRKATLAPPVIPDPIGDPIPETPSDQETTPDQLPPDSSSNSVPEEAGLPEPVPDDRTTETEPMLAQTDWTENPERPRRQAGHMSLRLNAATAGTGNSGKALVYHDLGIKNTDSGTNVINRPEKSVLPISVGVSLSIPLSRKLALTAGLDYMQRGGYGEDKTRQLTLHYLGVPVELLYYFNPDQRWRFYLGAGLHAAKSIFVSGGEGLPDPVLFSGNLMAGTDIRLLPGVRFYLAPSLSVPFNHSAYLNTRDAKLQFQLRAGLTFDLK